MGVKSHLLVKGAELTRFGVAPDIDDLFLPAAGRQAPERLAGANVSFQGAPDAPAEAAASPFRFR